MHSFQFSVSSWMNYSRAWFTLKSNHGNEQRMAFGQREQVWVNQMKFYIPHSVFHLWAADGQDVKRNAFRTDGSKRLIRNKHDNKDISYAVRLVLLQFSGVALFADDQIESSKWMNERTNKRRQMRNIINIYFDLIFRTAKAIDSFKRICLLQITHAACITNTYTHTCRWNHHHHHHRHRYH